MSNGMQRVSAKIEAVVYDDEVVDPNGEWVLVRRGPEWPVECYAVDASGLEVFRGYLHRAPNPVHYHLSMAWRAATATAA